jgi:hypothetical protein
MNRTKSQSASRLLIIFLAGLLALPFPGLVNAQNKRSGVAGTIEAGTTIEVRTSEKIEAKSSDDGETFDAVVDKDVPNRRGSVAIPKGSPVELVVRNISKDEAALDIDSIVVNGQRYSIDVDENVYTSEKKDGIGANERTGKYVGGGAVIGAIIGGIAGGGKGAAIGAGAGAAAGAGAQVLTRGKSIEVPAESLLTFRLSKPLRANGSTLRSSVEPRDTDRYADSAPYRRGLRDGRADADRNLPRNVDTGRWNTNEDRREYEAGYNDGYASVTR